MQKEKKDKHFLKKAYYPGGMQAMKAFIKKQLQYPPQALQKGIQGNVQLMLTIDHKGHVRKVHILKHLGHGCDEEALRVARLLKFVVPPLPNNKKVKRRFQKKLAIHFRLPRQENNSPQTPIVLYNYTTHTNTSSYEYSIGWNASEEE